MTDRTHIATLHAQLMAALPALDPADRRLSLALYRRLSEGAPVVLATLAAEKGRSAEHAVRRVRRWPGVYYDAERRVVGYWGLALARMVHRLRIDARELYAWCAWDTLFLPALLGRAIEVSSVCRATGQPVELSVSPREIASATPRGLVVSFLVPDAGAVREDVITSFCHYVHFFVSADTAQPWLAEHPGTFLLTLGEAYELGRRRNRALYGAELGFG